MHAYKSHERPGQASHLSSLTSKQQDKQKTFFGNMITVTYHCGTSSWFTSPLPSNYRWPHESFLQVPHLLHAHQSIFSSFTFCRLSFTQTFSTFTQNRRGLLFLANTGPFLSNGCSTLILELRVRTTTKLELALSSFLIAGLQACVAVMEFRVSRKNSD